MVERLRSRWRRDMPFDAIVELRDDFDAMLQRIRSERHIRSPIFRCPKCGHVGEGAAPHVSVRVMILPLARSGIIADEQTRLVERDWKTQQEKLGLDLFGRPTVTKSTPRANCDHPLAG